MTTSDWFMLIWDNYPELTADLPAPVTELRFAPPRRWRFDFAFPEQGLAVEIEGAVWTNGRHTRGAGYAADCEKYNAAVLAGWRILRFTSDQLNADPRRVIETISTALTSAKYPCDNLKREE